MKPSAMMALVVLALAAILIVLIVQNDEPLPAGQPTPAPELPMVQPTASAWNTPRLGPEPNAYEPNRWWQPNNCDPNDPYCPRR